ncbi:hypothetical protein MVEN_01588400 [Mycena venus]|uniref:Cellobiose dehydrogenase cytochrome domain-containing protein n=1 Tax=Mycena venus TaxID=2733690 RepID=A0A8H7CRN9_9AGAR|nr:hypothetical protein MVEN_01588400 [Mycena venus]
MFMLHLFTLGLLATASAAKSHTVCDPVTGLCFEQFFNSVLNVTIGFALPPMKSKDFVNEVLVLGVSYIHLVLEVVTQTVKSFPLPYGFAGVVLESDDNARRAFQQGPVTLAWYAIFTSAEEASETPFSTEYCRAEIATAGSNHTLMPLITAPIVTTFSPLTTWGNGGAQFIFRCQNCSIITDHFTNAKAKLTTVISTSYPVYIDNTLTLANLSLTGAQYQEFTLDTKAAQFSNYSSILAAASLL